MKTNKNGVKLLAAAMAFAMVLVAGFVVIGGDDSSVDAAANDNIKYFSGTLDGINEVPSGTIAYVDKNTSIVSVDSDKDGTNDKIGSIVVRAGGYLRINSGVTLTINNAPTTITYDNTDTDKITAGYAGLIIEKGAYVVIDGDVVVKANGGIYNDGVYSETANSAKKVQGVYSGVYINGNITVEKQGNITGKDISTDITSLAIGNEMIVGSAGSVEFKSSTTSKSTVSNQTFSIVEGGNVVIDANVTGPVQVGSFSTGSDYRITSYVMLATEANLAGIDNYFWLTGAPSKVTDNSAGTYATSGTVNLTFSVKNQKADKIMDGGQPSSKYVCAVLDVSGSVGDNAVLATLANDLDKNVAKDDGTDSGIRAYGITQVSKTLDIGKGAYFATIGCSNVLVSGDLNIDGSKDNKANAVMAGLLTVSGNVKIASVNPSVSNAWTTNGTKFNSDATVNLFIYQSGCFIKIEGDGEVTIDAYEPKEFGNGNWSQVPEGTLGVTYIDSDEVFHITSLAKAVAGDNDDEITINAIRGNGNLIGETKYIISADFTIPEDLVVTIIGNVVVEEKVTLSISEGAELVSPYNYGVIEIKGYLYDYNVTAMTILPADTTSITGVYLIAEVMATDADETYSMYTSMKNSLSASNPGDTITLFGNVELDKNLTIPAGITVETDGKYIAVLPGVELTVEGTIDTTESTPGKIVLVYKTAEITKIGTINVKNIVVTDKIYKAAESNSGYASTSTEEKVAGIYAIGAIGDFDTPTTNFILGPAVAAENSQTLTSMEVNAKTTYSGELVLTAADDATTAPVLTIKAETSFGTITLKGWNIATTATGGAKLSATIEADVTAGASSVKLDKVNNAATFSVETDDSGDEPVTHLAVTVNSATLVGNMNIATGSVTLVGTLNVGTWSATKEKSILTVDADATLIVKDESAINVVAKDFSTNSTTDYAGLVVKGTLSVKENNSGLTAAKDTATNHKSGMILVEGTLDISDADITIAGIINITGSLVIDTADETQAKVSVPADGKMTVGKAPETLGAAPSVSGVLDIVGTLVVYPGADMSGALININSSTGESNAYKLDLMIGDDLYMTAYTTTDATLTSLIPAHVKITGYEDISAANWYVDKDLKTLVGDKKVTDYSVVYAKATPSTANIKVSVGTGMSLWIDGVRYDSGAEESFKVGEYDIEVTTNPGYKGTSKILLAGVEITNGKMVITPEMSKASETTPVVLSVIGDISIDNGSSSGSSSSDDGMGITDILLIVLVVLAAILVVIVALRMMRS